MTSLNETDLSFDAGGIDVVFELNDAAPFTRLYTP